MPGEASRDESERKEEEEEALIHILLPFPLLSSPSGCDGKQSFSLPPPVLLLISRNPAFDPPLLYLLASGEEGGGEIQCSLRLPPFPTLCLSLPLLPLALHKSFRVRDSRVRHLSVWETLSPPAKVNWRNFGPGKAGVFSQVSPWVILRFLGGGKGFPLKTSVFFGINQPPQYVYGILRTL